MFLTLIIFFLILGLLVFVHEFGHFIVAKRSGIRVLEFAFGFPPRLFAIKKGETEYVLNLLPIGGYVKMLGEEDDATQAEKKHSHSYAHQSVGVRAKVVVAGVVMNAVLAWLLITIGFIVGITPLVTQPTKIPLAKVITKIVVSAIAQPSAAAAMGVKANDVIISLNNEPITSVDQLPIFTKAHAGEAVTLKVKRHGQEMILTGTLGTGDGPLGVRIGDDTSVRLPIWWAPIYAVWETLKAIGLLFVGIFGFFREILIRHHIPADAAGPVGIFYYTRSVLDLGFGALINFIAILSLNLGVINILPIPALDGGRLLFILLEKFNRGRKIVNQRIENIAHTVGFALLIALIITITYNDILKLGK